MRKSSAAEDVISNGLHVRARVILCFIKTTIFSSNFRGHPPNCQPWCLFWPLVSNALSHIKGYAALGPAIKSSRRVCAFPMTSPVNILLTKARLVFGLLLKFSSSQPPKWHFCWNQPNVDNLSHWAYSVGSEFFYWSCVHAFVRDTWCLI